MINSNKLHKKKCNKSGFAAGFTLIELIIASAVISVGFLAVVSLALNTFSQTVPLSYNLTASYLTQEGFEVVRRIRDHNFNIKYTEDDERFWLENLIDDQSNEGDETIGGLDYESTSLEEGMEEDYLKVDGQGFFNYEEGDETTFKREVSLQRLCYDGYHDYGEGAFEDDLCGEDEAEYVLVTIRITWEDKGEEYSHEASTKLFNWY